MQVVEGEGPQKSTKGGKWEGSVRGMGRVAGGKGMMGLAFRCRAGALGGTRGLAPAGFEPGWAGHPF